MTSQRPAARTLLILGATGDLTTRLLLPGLGVLLASGVGEGLSLVGSAIDEGDDDGWRRRVSGSFAAAGVQGTQVEAVAKGSRYLQADVTSDGDLRRLLDACGRPMVMYFALPPAVAMQACRVLAGIGLPEGTRLVLEKPSSTASTPTASSGTLVPIDTTVTGPPPGDAAPPTSAAIPATARATEVTMLLDHPGRLRGGDRTGEGAARGGGAGP